MSVADELELPRRCLHEHAGEDLNGRTHRETPAYDGELLGELTLGTGELQTCIYNHVCSHTRTS